MKAVGPQLAIAVASWWVRLYTCGVDRTIADARRAEFESDLWESLHDRGRSDGSTARSLEILDRLVRGVPADLAWCFAERQSQGRARENDRRAGMNFTASQTGWMGLAAVLGGLLWVAGYVSAVFLGAADLWQVTLSAAPLLMGAGLLAFYAGQGGRTGRLGMAGFGLLLVALTIVLLRPAAVWIGNYLFPPTFAIVVPLGFLLFGLGVMRAGTFPRVSRSLPLVVGILLATTSLLGAFGLIFRDLSPVMQSFYRPGSPIEVLSVTCFGVGWAAMGLALWSRRAEVQS